MSGAQPRLASLDAFRGFTIAAMILVNNPGDWDAVYAPLRHAEWNGCTPTDLVFPFFLFIAGVALALATASARDSGVAGARFLRKCWMRALILIGLGLLLNGYPDFDLERWRIPGVLQRIGLVFGIAAILAVYLRARGWLIAACALLISYAMLLSCGGDLSPAGNLGAHLDRALFGTHLWRQTWDPEGLLGTLPATATVLIGLLTGDWLTRVDDRHRGARNLFVAGIVLLVAGLSWHPFLPINKNLWSPAYVLVTAGAALNLFAVAYWFIDVRGLRTWARPLIAIGMNSIVLYVGSELLAATLWRVIEVGEPPISASAWLFLTVFLPWAGPLNGSLAYALANVLLWYLVAEAFYRRRIFFSI